MKRIGVIIFTLFWIGSSLYSAGTQESEVEASKSEPEFLTIWVDEARAEVLSELGPEFTEKFGVELQIQEMGFGDVRDQLKVAGPAGQGPDLLIGAHDWLGELVINGLVEPVELGEKSDLFMPAAVEAFSYDGKVYGLPYLSENIAFIRNPDLVPEAPETWSEVEEIAIELEENGAVEAGFIRQDGDPYHFFPLLTAFGGYIFGMNENGYNAADVGVDSNGGLAAAEWLEKMTLQGHMFDGVDYEVLHTMFEQKKAAMIITGPWALDRIRTSGVSYAISPIPSETSVGRPFLGVQGFMINSFSSKKLLAQIFLKDFIASEEAMKSLSLADSRPSTFMSVRNAISDPDISAFGKAGVVGMPMPAIPEMSAVWQSMHDALVLIAQGSQSGDEAFSNAALQIRTAISEN